MNKEFVLKHKNIPVASFIMDDESYESGQVKNVYDEKRLPFGSQRAETKESIATYLNRWINYRGIPQSREDFGDIALANKISFGRELSMGSYGLNLTDHYWVHKKEKDYKWEDFNFFDNGYTDNFEMKNNYVKGKQDPNVSVDGTLVKCWNRENGGNVLWKKGRGLLKQEPYNELIASKILDLFGIEHVAYTLGALENGQPVSKCPCMVDKENEYINADFIFFDSKLKGGNLYESYINICKDKGITDCKERIDEMMALDFIIGNTDRHYGNFGIIREADSLKWKRIVPVFDNGSSLFYNEILSGVQNKTESNCIWLPGGNEEHLKLIGYPSWYDREKGKEIPGIVYEGLNKNNRLREVPGKIDEIISVIEQRIKIFENAIQCKKGQVTGVS